MDAFNFCWMTLLGESKKCNIFFDKDTCNVKNEIDENYSKPLNRISYLYKFGAFNISLFHQCFQEFCAKVPDSFNIINYFRSVNKLTICSMSAGPGTDIIGFLYSLYLINKPLQNAVDFKVISRHGAWRNLVTEMINSSIITVPEKTTCKLIECDFLKDLSKKAQGYLKEADILLMCDSFSSLSSPEKVCSTLKNIVLLLKPGALVFFIFSKEKTTYVKELLSFGSFLFEPVEVTLEDMLYNEKIVELVGVKPVCSGVSSFAVWQKSHEIKHEMNCQNETKNNLTVCRKHNSLTELVKSKRASEDNFQMSTLSYLKRECSSDSNSSSSLGSSTLLSSSGISSQTRTDISDNCAQQNNDISKSFINNSVKKTALAPGSSVKKKNVLPTERPIARKDINSLLESFDCLISKLEGLINSNDSLRHPHHREMQPVNDQHCHQNLHQGQCRCLATSCQFNSTLCCYSSIHNNCNHDHSTSVPQNLYQTIHQEVPSIVIPLQNLSKESLADILSLVSQNDSANKTALN